MPLEESEKLELEKRMVDLMLDQMAEGKLTDNQAQSISRYCEESLKNVKNKQHLSEFLSVLVSKYPFFQSIQASEQGKVDEAVDKEVHEGALVLAQHGKIEEAIKLTQTATN